LTNRSAYIRIKDEEFHSNQPMIIVNVVFVLASDAASSRDDGSRVQAMSDLSVLNSENKQTCSAAPENNFK
jgi:hypothetical protein